MLIVIVIAAIVIVLAVLAIAIFVFARSAQRSLGKSGPRSYDQSIHTIFMCHRYDVTKRLVGGFLFF